MMDINSIFSPELTIVCESTITNKKKVLEKISKLISTHVEKVKYHHLFDALQQREKIGNTALGHGIAIPHARIEQLATPHCAVLCLRHGVNFSTDDEASCVDLVFGLVVPENYNETHLCLLSQLSEKLLNAGFREKLRQAQSSQLLYNQLIDNE